jgi:hypothetical protein
MNNHFLDGERVKSAENVNCLDIQERGVDGAAQFDTLTTVNDSETSASSDTRLTQLHSPFVLASHGEAA